MSLYKAILAISFSLFLFSCQPIEEANVRVKNNISNVKIGDIMYGDEYISGSIITGNNTGYVTISDERDHWPKTMFLTFSMTANNRVVFLQTISPYTIDAGDDLTITLDDNTPVFSPR